jgi:hypothetical protein
MRPGTAYRETALARSRPFAGSATASIRRVERKLISGLEANADGVTVVLGSRHRGRALECACPSLWSRASCQFS